MKYVSLDLETTGIDNKSPENILMISMVVEDPKNPMPLKDLPHFTRFVRYSKISGEPFALAMNGWILDIISDRKENTTPFLVSDEGGWITAAERFLAEHFPSGNGKIPVAGKNVGTFDLQFLPKRLKDRISYKIIDPAMLFTDLVNDEKVAGLETCKQRAGLEPVVSHNAYEDALDVIATLRSTYGKQLK